MVKIRLTLKNQKEIVKELSKLSIKKPEEKKLQKETKETKSEVKEESSEPEFHSSNFVDNSVWRPKDFKLEDKHENLEQTAINAPSVFQSNNEVKPKTNSPFYVTSNSTYMPTSAYEPAQKKYDSDNIIMGEQDNNPMAIRNAPTSENYASEGTLEKFAKQQARAETQRDESGQPPHHRSSKKTEIF